MRLVPASSMPDRAVDEYSISWLRVNGNFPLQRFVLLLLWREIWASMGSGDNPGESAALVHHVEINNGVDGQRAITGEAEVAVPGPIRKCGPWVLAQEVVLEQIVGGLERRIR